MSILGKGSYGTVVNLNNNAVKTSERFNPFVQELVILKYLKYSDYILNLISYDLSERVLTMDLYDCSLKQHTQYYLTESEKEKLFVDTLRGLADLHSRDIIHSDLKLSNILMKLEPLGAVLCDFGLSSIKNHARTYNVAPISRPDIIFPNNEHTHDMFGLCVSFTQVFGDIEFTKRVGREKLRLCINRRINNEKIRRILLSCIEDEAVNIPTSIDILNQYYEGYECADISIPRRFRKLKIDGNVRNIYFKISSEYSITERRKLGCRLFIYVEQMICDKTEKYNRLFCVHIVIFMISCMYKRYERRERRMTRELILNKFPDKINEDFNRYITYIIDDNISLNMLVSRKFRHKIAQQELL